ncbi:MAG TPA: glycosyltransferase [Terriglobia bacterium]|nr:glycosyltransferase [Terriglobia bacterium]
MRIAYLTARLPFPPIGGYRMRVYYTLRHLLRSHEVTLYAMDSRVKLSGASPHPDLPGLRQRIFTMGKAAYAWNGLAAFFSGLPLQVKLYECPEFVQALDADIRSGAFDLLFVHLVRMAEYARPYHHLPRVLDMADSIYLHYARMRKIWWSPWWVGAQMDRNRIRRYEAEVPRWFDSVMVHTEEDLEWVQKQSGATNLVQSSMGVDTEEFAFQEGTYNPRRIVYCGKLDYLPNTDAALYFANEIFPLVRRQVPDAQFAVVGLNPPRSLRALARTSGIEVRANVPDIRPEVSSAAVSVAPIRFGAGIQNKVLQSLAMGVPVVATPLAAKPFGERSISPVLAGETPQEFAGHVVRILQDSGYRAQLARAGRKLIETCFQWEQVLAPLDSILERVAENKVVFSPRSGSV